MKNLLAPKTEAMLNKAIAAELFAHNFYRHLANQMQRLGYFGAAKFFSAEAAAELEHYQLHVDYINDRGSVAKVPEVPAMKDPVTGLRDAVDQALETELQLGEDYEAWYSECGCVTTQQHLLQFLETQRRSVGEFGDLQARLERAGDDACGLLLIDQEMKAQ